MSMLVYNGDATARSTMREHEFYLNGNKQMLKFHCLITTYEILLLDEQYLSRPSWKFVVVDEAHRLKNKDSKSAQLIKGKRPLQSPVLSCVVLRSLVL